MLRVWLARVVALFRRSQGRDLDKEIRTQLRMAVDECGRRGMSPGDAPPRRAVELRLATTFRTALATSPCGRRSVRAAWRERATIPAGWCSRDGSASRARCID